MTLWRIRAAASSTWTPAPRQASASGSRHLEGAPGCDESERQLYEQHSELCEHVAPRARAVHPGRPEAATRRSLWSIVLLAIVGADAEPLGAPTYTPPPSK